MLNERLALRISACASLLGGVFEAFDGLRPMWVPILQVALGAGTLIWLRFSKNRAKRLT